LIDGLWTLQNPADMEKNPVVKEYLSEKDMNDEMGVFGNIQLDRRGKLGISLSGGGTYFNGDYSDSPILPAAEVGIDFPANKTWSGVIGNWLHRTWNVPRI
jgi:hypothetical protein